MVYDATQGKLGKVADTAVNVTLWRQLDAKRAYDAAKSTATIAGGNSPLPAAKGIGVASAAGISVLVEGAQEIHSQASTGLAYGEAFYANQNLGASLDNQALQLNTRRQNQAMSHALSNGIVVPSQ